MFTGFASENTPAIQVWNYFQTSASTSAVRSVSLADDCAPIQYFKTGSNTTVINLYLPTAPIEGKQIKIVNANYTSTNQSINVYSSDTNGAGTTNPFIVIGSGQTLDLCYSKDFIFVNANGQFNTGWISLNQSPIGAYAFNAVVVGGNNNSAVASRAAVIGGSNNTASGQSSGVFGGGSNTASGSSSAVVGGSSSSATASGSIVLGGSTLNATVSNSAVVAGANNTANGSNSFIAGGAYGVTRTINGNSVLPASINPISSFSGISQSAMLILGRQTTDATATRLASNTSAASTTNQVILPNNSAYTFQGTCIANVTAGGTTSGWKFEGVIKRGANAASTALVAAVTPVVIAQDVAAATWVLAITADTTNGGIAVTVTGAAATTIRWVVQIETTEVTF
jgi:hypothetical protein